MSVTYFKYRTHPDLGYDELGTCRDDKNMTPSSCKPLYIGMVILTDFHYNKITEVGYATRVSLIARLMGRMYFMHYLISYDSLVTLTDFYCNKIAEVGYATGLALSRV